MRFHKIHLRSLLTSARELLRRRRLRFRTSVSSLFLLMAVASVLALDMRWQTEQQQLADEVAKLGGVVEYQPRNFPWRILGWLRFQSRPHEIRRIAVSGHIASGKFSGVPLLPSEIARLLAMRGMRSVPILSLKGTAVTDSVIEQVAQLQNLREFTVNLTGVRKSRLVSLTNALPNCAISIGNSNSPEFLKLAHTDHLKWTTDIADFQRSQRGDTSAATRLLESDLVGREAAVQLFVNALIGYRLSELRQHVERNLDHENVELRWNALQLLSTWDKPKTTSALRALSDDSPRIKKAALAILKSPQDTNTLTMVARLLSDPDAQVQQAALTSIAGSELPEAAMLLEDVYHQNIHLRLTIVEVVSNTNPKPFRDILFTAIQSSNPELKIAACGGLSQVVHRSTIRLLTQATSDPHPEVRSASLNALHQVLTLEALSKKPSSTGNPGS